MSALAPVEATHYAQIRGAKPQRWILASNIATLGAGVAGVALGVDGLVGRGFALAVSGVVPPFGLALRTTELGSFFEILVAVVATCVAIYNFGYAKSGHLSAISLAIFPVFVATLETIPMTASIPSFLFFWELMAFESICLVLDRYQRERAQHAALLYAAVTQLGFFSILGFFALVASKSHGLNFGSLQYAVASLSPGQRNLAFVLALVGFGSKAGLVPLHAWLPKAHPEAPAPASALMSTAMVSLGIFGLIKFVAVLMPGGPTWWGMVLLGIGAVSSIYGVIESSVSSDLKVLLAYSTTENMGLATLALGTQLVMTSTHHQDLAWAAAIASVFILGSHAMFKGLAFLAAGAVGLNTGTTDLNDLGGLTRRMRFTSGAFGLAALSASGLPLGSAFIGEWILLQSLIHLGPAKGVVALAAPLTIGAIALTSGIGLLTMVKAFGIGFLGKARSDLGEVLEERVGPMQLAMGLLVLSNLAIALVPALFSSIVKRIAWAAPLHAQVGSGHVQLGQLTVHGLTGSIFPLASAALFALAVLASAAVIHLRRRSRPSDATVELWACGARDLNSAMQYNASSFAEPLERVFADVIRPKRDVEIISFEESRLLISRVELRSTPHDSIESALYPRVWAVATYGGRLARLAHNGSLNRYLAFGAAGLLIVLAVLH